MHWWGPRTNIQHWEAQGWERALSLLCITQTSLQLPSPAQRPIWHTPPRRFGDRLEPDLLRWIGRSRGCSQLQGKWYCSSFVQQSSLRCLGATCIRDINTDLRGNRARKYPASGYMYSEMWCQYRHISVESTSTKRTYTTSLAIGPWINIPGLAYPGHTCIYLAQSLSSFQSAVIKAS